MSNDSGNYPRLVARTLMGLKRMPLAELARHTDMSAENLAAFLQGVEQVLSEVSYSALFAHLGIEKYGLSRDRVHYWHLKYGYRPRKEIAKLEAMKPLLGEHGAIALPRRGNVTPILIRTEEARIILLVEAAPFKRVTVSDLGLTPAPFKCQDSLNLIPPYYLDQVFTSQLRGNHFDAIQNGEYRHHTIDFVRLVAIEHDVTVREIVDWIKEKEALAAEQAPYCEVPITSDDNSPIRLIFSNGQRRAA